MQHCILKESGPYEFYILCFDDKNKGSLDRETFAKAFKEKVEVTKFDSKDGDRGNTLYRISI
jgi:hypothetical protein